MGARLCVCFQIGEAILALDDRSYYERGKNETILENYLKIMTNSAELLGAERNQAESEMRKVLDFETELAMVSC